jgi:hypothetical protein
MTTRSSPTDWPMLVLCCAGLLSATALAQPPIAEMPKQMQLDRASRHQLQDLQGPPANPPVAPATGEARVREQLNRRQQVEQQMLQERQRREILMRRQRSGISPDPAWRQRLDAINRHRQFQRQQQQQLNRFRIEQGLPRPGR